MSSTLENDARGMRDVVTLHHFGNISDCGSIDRIFHMATIWQGPPPSFNSKEEESQFTGRMLFALLRSEETNVGVQS